MPTATISCRPSTYRKSSGKSRYIGNSVDPGLPKIVVVPKARKRSKTASRTVTWLLAGRWPDIAIFSCAGAWRASAPAFDLLARSARQEGGPGQTPRLCRLVNGCKKSCVDRQIGLGRTPRVKKQRHDREN